MDRNSQPRPETPNPEPRRGALEHRSETWGETNSVSTAARKYCRPQPFRLPKLAPATARRNSCVYKCPLPSVLPRAHSDATVGSSLLSFANWITNFLSQPFGIDRTPTSVLLAPSAADSQFFTVLCSETAANWSFLNKTGKLLPQIFGESLQGPLLPLSLIQATGNTPAFLSIVKNRPIQLEFFSPLAQNTFIPSLNGSLNALPPQNQIRAVFVAANSESVPLSFQHFFICF
ncbi:hypothetical protein BDR26DRAFT_848492 [Obelidium mucronatum]|nr:hypothetical protein BDR26DRAFT_848492 [Obelidium mucronatum]